MKLISLLGRSMLYSIIILYCLRFLFLISTLLGPFSVFLSPILWIVYYPIYSFFILSMVISLNIFLKEKKKIQNPVVSLQEQPIKFEKKLNPFSSIGFIVGIIYIIWFGFFNSINGRSLDSMNCLFFPCPSTSLSEISLDIAPSILGFSIKKEDKIFNSIEKGKEKNLSVCLSFDSENTKSDCVNSILKRTNDPSQCIEAYRIGVTKDTKAIYSCYVGIAIKSKDLNICSLIPEYEPFISELKTTGIKNGKDECLISLVKPYTTNFVDIFSKEEELNICKNISEEKTKALCYSEVSKKRIDLSVCDELKNNEEGFGICRENFVSFFISYPIKDNEVEKLTISEAETICSSIKHPYYRNECYFSLYYLNKDKKWCEYIKNLDNWEGVESLRSDYKVKENMWIFAKDYCLAD